MKLICVTGMPGCGKEEFVRTLREMGLPVVHMGDVVRAEAQKRGLKFSDNTVGGLANEERLKHGKGIWAQRTVPFLSQEIMVVEGIRCSEELEIFKQKLQGELVLVAIHSSPRTRHERLIARARPDDVTSQEEFEKRDIRELSWGLGKVIALADYMIINEGTIEELKSNAVWFLKSQGLVK